MTVEWQGQQVPLVLRFDANIEEALKICWEEGTPETEIQELRHRWREKLKAEEAAFDARVEATGLTKLQVLAPFDGRWSLFNLRVVPFGF
jgi:hypothetical protein